jgi:uncharacterized protein
MMQDFSVPAARNGVRIERGLAAPMRDDIMLVADLYLPKTGANESPAILIRTPYGRAAADEQGAPLAKFLAGQGFAVLVQDVRGTGASAGIFKPYTCIEGPDGYDTLEWMVAQPWCDGRIGTCGCSYLGEVQDLLAAERHPNHKAAFIEGAYTYNNGGMRAFSFVRYGALELAYAVGGDLDLLSTLPISALRQRMADPKASYYAKRWPDAVDVWLTKAPLDPVWDDDGGLGDESRFDVPALHVNEWNSLPFSALRMFDLYRTNGESARARNGQYLLMSPMTHCRTATAAEETRVGERDLGDARFPYHRLMVDWFDHWLRDIPNGIVQMPKVQYFLMGSNRWRSAECWPPAGTTLKKLFLENGTGANTLHGDGRLVSEQPAIPSHDHFRYDPGNPVPSCGGPVSGGQVFKAGSFDQRQVETRIDVLVYTTDSLPRGIEVSGPVEVVLFVSSTAIDTDFTAKLVDVYPDGRAFNLVEGIVRMRYRRGLDDVRFLEPGDIHKIRIDLDSTSNYFGTGHRIRLEISSSNFPRFDRNLNTGGSIADGETWVVAENHVFHGGMHDSHVLLPVCNLEGGLVA